MYEKLFTPGYIGKLEIRNRIVQEPMGNAYSNKQGEATDKEIAFYTERAKGGVGLILTETMMVQKGTGGGNDKQMSLAYDENIPGMKKLTDSVHQHGAKIIAEIYHSGRQGVPDWDPQGKCPAPSAIDCKLTHIPSREISHDEILQLEKDFISAARRAKESGFDGVEIHCAHGYILNEFLSPYTNHRTDEYGGSLENRMRIVKNIIDGIRAELGDYVVIVRITVDEFLRMNGIDDGITLDMGVEICKNFEKFGFDAIDVSSGIYETMNVAWEPTGFDQGWKSHMAAEVKKNVSIPVFCTAVLRDPAYCEMLLENGTCDFVGSARTHLADPYWANKAKEERTNEIRRCISCLTCMETLMAGGPEGCQCAVNPEAGHEFEWNDFSKIGDGRSVVVVGAGPAGMEAAHVLARRGFEVTILEAKSEVGGQLCYANKPPKKEKVDWFIDYHRAMLEKHNIQVRLNTPATVESIKELDPYALIWTAGATPIMPRSIEGIDCKCVLKTTQILSGEIKLFGKKVCVVGSGMTGIETAEFLADMGNEVDVYEMVDEIGPGMHFQNLIDVLGRCGEHNVGLFPKHKLVKIQEGSAEFENTETGETETVTFDYLVLSLGTAATKPSDDIVEAFPNIIVAGDAEKAGRIQHATSTAFVAAYNLK